MVTSDEIFSWLRTRKLYEENKFAVALLFIRTKAKPALLLQTQQQQQQKEQDSGMANIRNWIRKQQLFNNKNFFFVSKIELSLLFFSVCVVLQVSSSSSHFFFCYFSLFFFLFATSPSFPFLFSLVRSSTSFIFLSLGKLLWKLFSFSLKFPPPTSFASSPVLTIDLSARLDL